MHSTFWRFSIQITMWSWSRIFRSCIFNPCNFGPAFSSTIFSVLRFLVLLFPTLEIWSLSLANVNSCSCSLYVVVRPSVCRLSYVCRLSVTFVHPTQPIEIFGSVSAPFNTMVTWRHPGKILRRSSHGRIA